MKILLTGGAGFIGSHIADAYIKQGHKVAVLDDLSKGFRTNLNPKAKFYKVDIRDAKAVRRVILKEQPQILNHHAAIAEVVRSLRDQLPTLQVNVDGTANLLISFGADSRAKNKKFIFASTGGAIYGEPKKIPVAESVPPAPLSAYGLSKKMSEDLVHFLSLQYGFEHLIFRYANVYGPRQNPRGEAGVVAIFGGLMKAGREAIIFGNGRKTRDYVHVADIVRANVLGLTKGSNTELNLGWGREISDREVFNNIAKFYGYSKTPRFAPHRSGEVHRITLDARKAKRVLGWTPKMEFEKGIKSTLQTI